MPHFISNSKMILIIVNSISQLIIQLNNFISVFNQFLSPVIMNVDQIICNEGLPNNGNTCFLNSAIQSLYAIDSFRSLIEQTTQKNFTSLIRGIFLSIKEGSPLKQRKRGMKELVNYLTKCDIDYKGYSQQDSSQFLLLILENLIKQSPQIENIFKVYYKFKCLTCGKSLKLKQYLLSKLYVLCENDQCHDRIKIDLINRPKAIIYCGKSYQNQNLYISHVNGQILEFSLVSSILYSGTGRSGHYVCSRRLTQEKTQFRLFNDASVEENHIKYHFDAKIQIFQLKTIKSTVSPIKVVQIPKVIERSSQEKHQEEKVICQWLRQRISDFCEMFIFSSG